MYIIMLIILNKNENQRDYNELIGNVTTIEERKKNYHREYYNNNIIYFREHYRNKQKIKIKQFIKCSCGSKIVSYRYNIHLSSGKHIFYVRMIELDSELDSLF